MAAKKSKRIIHRAIKDLRMIVPRITSYVYLKKYFMAAKKSKRIIHRAIKDLRMIDTILFAGWIIEIFNWNNVMEKIEE